MLKMESRFRFPRPRILAWTLLVGMTPMFISSGIAYAQDMKQMPGMGSPKQGTTASGTGTVTAVNAANRKITLDHGPMPEIKWPAMKMEFAVAPSVDLSKVKTGDKLRFTVSGSGSTYTVQSIAPQ
jgi:Cu(I)/Ag(I) efflux system periplasmic protein CusF